MAPIIVLQQAILFFLAELGFSYTQPLFSLPTFSQELNGEHLLNSLITIFNAVGEFCKFKQIVKIWVKTISRAKGLNEQLVQEANAKIFTFGSYRLGV